MGFSKVELVSLKMSDEARKKLRYRSAALIGFLGIMTILLFLAFRGTPYSIIMEDIWVIGPGQRVEVANFEAFAGGYFSYTLVGIANDSLLVTLNVGGVPQAQVYSEVGGGESARFSEGEAVSLTIENLQNNTANPNIRYIVQYDYLFSDFELFMIILILMISIGLTIFGVLRWHMKKMRN